MRRRGEVTEDAYRIVHEDLSREGERLKELNPVGEELEHFTGNWEENSIGTG
jgi:hypothetical protein